MNIGANPRAYQTSDPKSFAFTWARHRRPAILQDVTDDVRRTLSTLQATASAEVMRREGETIIAALTLLKHEHDHNFDLTPLPDDGFPGIEEYNTELQARGALRWHDTEWLWSECYMYRRMATVFNLAEDPFWKAYDVFQRQKTGTFKASRPAVIELAANYRAIIAHISSSSAPNIEEEERLLFSDMAEICLWGNATDLGILANPTYEDIQKVQGSQARKESKKHILVNDLDRVFEVLSRARQDGKSERRVDIVLIMQALSSSWI